MRNTFAQTLHENMAKNKRIWLLTGDVGFGVLDKIKDDFPDRFINCGVAEQNMVGVACGMAHSGLIPFVYSITPFLIYRAFEFIRNDVDYDKANVKLVGIGRGNDYESLGFSHCCNDDKLLFIEVFKNVHPWWPDNKEVIPSLMGIILRHNGPDYLNLGR